MQDRELTDLSVEVAVSHDPVASGEILTYTLNVHNEGPDAADDVELHLRNAVMHGLVLTGASTSGGAPPSCSELADAKGYACRLGDLGAGETIVVTLEFELALSLADGETFNTLFAVMSHTEDLALENNSAAAASTVRVADRVVLAALYNATGGRNWSHQRDWLSGEPIGDWYGVTTDGIGRVTALDLYQNHLTGTIPPELAGLPSPKQLHLSGPPSLRRRRAFSLGPAAGPPLSLTTTVLPEHLVRSTNGGYGTGQKDCHFRVEGGVALT